MQSAHIRVLDQLDSLLLDDAHLHCTANALRPCLDRVTQHLKRNDLRLIERELAGVDVPHRAEREASDLGRQLCTAECPLIDPLRGAGAEQVQGDRLARFRWPPCQEELDVIASIRDRRARSRAAPAGATSARDDRPSAMLAAGAVGEVRTLARHLARRPPRAAGLAVADRPSAPAGRGASLARLVSAGCLSRGSRHPRSARPRSMSSGEQLGRARSHQHRIIAADGDGSVDQRRCQADLRKTDLTANSG
jgi:hypothetical protein